MLLYQIHLNAQNEIRIDGIWTKRPYNLLTSKKSVYEKPLYCVSQQT